MKRYQVIAICMATALSTPLCFGQSAGSQTQDKSSDSSSIQSSSSGSQSATSLQPSDNAAGQSTLSGQGQGASVSSIRASKLIGVNVTSKDGTNLGQVQDIVLDPSTGKIRFALVSQGFMAGAGQTLFPVPWKAVNVQSEKQFVLNVDQNKLKTAPAWSETQIEQPDYVLRVFRFYNMEEPQSDIGGPGQSGEQSGTGQSSSSSSSSPDQQGSASQQHNQQGSTPDK